MITAYADFIDEGKKLGSTAAAMEPETPIYDMIEVLPEPPATPVESDDNEEVAVENGDDVEDEDEL